MCVCCALARLLGSRAVATLALESVVAACSVAPMASHCRALRPTRRLALPPLRASVPAQERTRRPMRVRARAAARVIELPVSDIRRPLARTRANDPAKVEALMESIAEIGLKVHFCWSLVHLGFE